MSLLYIFAASGIEAQPVRKIAGVTAGNSAGRCGVNDLILMAGAMGPRSAQDKAQAALKITSVANGGRKPDAVLVIGLCGGLSPMLPERRIVAFSECLSTEATKPPLACSQTILHSVMDLLTSSNIRCDRVVGITSPRLATTRSERLTLAGSGATVVDMESYSVLDAARAAGIPAAVIRVVSDSIDWELPDFNRALNDVGALDGRKALKVALGSPIRTARLLMANRRAMQSLAKALEIILVAECFT